MKNASYADKALTALPKWTSNLSVGVQYFDDDHKRLIGMMNTLHGLVREADARENITPGEIESALEQLEEYALYHCAQEEVFMANIGYPGLDAHKREHKEFLTKVTAMSKRFRGSKEAVHAAELVHFMYDWLVCHIEITDKKYADYLRDQGNS